MKERPILFSGPMIRALLAGTKTQTRRVVKNVQQNNCVLIRKPTAKRSGLEAHVMDLPGLGLCPFGQPGDRLWVRETHIVEPEGSPIPVVYRADYNEEDLGPGWTPSIFMRPIHSRITLELLAVRVERLNVISDDDSAADGIMTSRGVGLIDGARTFSVPGTSAYSRTGWHAYQKLWEDINGAGSWALNPWVWVIEFRRVKP